MSAVQELQAQLHEKHPDQVPPVQTEMILVAQRGCLWVVALFGGTALFGLAVFGVAWLVAGDDLAMRWTMRFTMWVFLCTPPLMFGVMFVNPLLFMRLLGLKVDHKSRKRVVLFGRIGSGIMLLVITYNYSRLFPLLLGFDS